MWGAGDWDSVADKTHGVGEVCVERAGVEAGMDVLDVACGTGNATFPAARAGARVTGLDFQPDLLALAREKRAPTRVEIEWVEGDAQQLPFEDARFDRVLSTFGHMFAPDHERAAAELKRVSAGTAISICCWSPDGTIGRMFRTIAEFVPSAARRELAAAVGHGGPRARIARRRRFERHEVEWIDASVETYANWMLESFGPLLNAQEALGERSGELRDAYLRHLKDENLSSDGTLRYRGEYLAAVVQPA